MNWRGWVLVGLVLIAILALMYWGGWFTHGD